LGLIGLVDIFRKVDPMSPMSDTKDRGVFFDPNIGLVTQTNLENKARGVEIVVETHNPIIGPPPDVRGFYTIAGFSGHGFSTPPPRDASWPTSSPIAIRNSYD